MALYAIGDLHLSLGTDKPMDVFGGAWAGYVDKIRAGFEPVSPDDTVILCGDISWGMSLPECAADFRFISSLPGKKIIVKGNHDYWFSTAAKLRAFLVSEGIEELPMLHNNCHFYEGIALCGTRGWFYEEDYKNSGDEKVFRREVLRLEASLSLAKKSGAEKIFCFLHYPPIYESYRCREILGMLSDFGVSLCCYGHLHGKSHKNRFEGEHCGVEYRLVSADFLNFRPLLLAK